MTARHERLTELFLEASKLDADERGRFLEETCADPELRREVVSLLGHRESVPGILAPGALAEWAASESMVQTSRIGPYRIERKLGDGAMGIVFLAEQMKPVRRSVAIKVLRPGVDTDEVIARFDSERRALALMDHPNIARVYDAGTTSEGRPFFAMEYIDGRPVDAWCDARRLTVRQRLELFLQVCAGVQHAHQRGVIHRDLKPSNVLVTVRGERPAPKIIDFGIAKATQQRLTEKTLLTATGMFVGTPAYMSPEQAAPNGHDVDTRTDVYSLGVMLYELLVGALPFGGNGLRGLGIDEIRRRIREEEPVRPSETLASPSAGAVLSARRRRTDPQGLRRQISADLDWITMKALEKDRDRRYASVAELAADVTRYLRHEPVLAGPPSAGYRARKFVRRHRVPVLATALVIVALLLGFSGTTFGLLRAIAAEGRARHDERIANEVSGFLLSIFEATPANRLRRTTASEVLDGGIAKIRDELGDQPVLQALLMHKVGKLQLDLGRFREASPLLQFAHDRLETLLGPDHPDTLRAASTLARLYWKQCRIAEAEELYLETLERQRRALGPDHADRLATLHELAFMYKSLGRFAEAAPLFEEAVEGRVRVLGPGDPETLLSRSLLASVYLDLDRLEECRSVLLASLDRMRAMDHPETANVLYNLGCVAARHGERERALNYLRQAVDGGTGGPFRGDRHLASLSGDPEFEALVRRRTLTLDSGRIARDRGRELVLRGRYAEAELLLLGSLDSMERLLGTEHPDTLSGIAYLADLYVREGRYDEAEPLIRRYLDYVERAFGPRYYEVGYVLWYLAQCRAGTGDTAGAVAMLEQAAAILDDAWLRGDAALRRASAQAFLGQVHAALASLKTAVALGELNAELNAEMLVRDLAFRSLRGRPEFEEILASLRGPGEPATAALVLRDGRTIEDTDTSVDGDAYVVTLENAR